MLSKIQASYHRQAFNHSSKIRFVLFFFFLLLLFIAYRLFSLQIYHGSEYKRRSDINQFTTNTLSAQRGRIFDRRGILLATNRPLYHIDLRFTKLKPTRHALKEAQDVLQLDDIQYKALQDEVTAGKFDRVIRLQKNLTMKDIQLIYQRLTSIHGIEITPVFIRHYPLGAACASVTGYSVAKNTKLTTIKQSETKHIAADYDGVSGIEQYYDTLLSGTNGIARYKRNAKGHLIEETSVEEAVPGHDLTLSIDSELQNIIHKHMKGHTGAVIVSNPRNGEILALYSAPSFDPNIFSNPKQRHLMGQYLHNNNKPLFNRAVQGLFPPASTIKPFLALHALQKNIIQPQDTIFDPGYYRFGTSEYIYHNWYRQGHGVVDVKKSLILSNDTFYYHLALKLGIGNIYEILSDYGFGKKTAIDLPGETQGLVPNKQWRKKQGKPWYKGDTIISGIGQGSQLATPIQMASSLSQLACYGKGYKLHLLKSYRDSDNTDFMTTPQPLPHIHTDKAYWQLIRQALRDVIQFGTGKKLKNSKVDLAGKTGTAQLIKNSGRDQGFAKHLLDHSWFIGFSPSENPDLTITILLEHENGAILLAKDILEEYQTIHDTLYR